MSRCIEYDKRQKLISARHHNDLFSVPEWENMHRLSERLVALDIMGPESMPPLNPSVAYTAVMFEGV